MTNDISLPESQDGPETRPKPRFDFRPALESDRQYLVDIEEICMRDYVIALVGEWIPATLDEIVPDEHRIVVRDGHDAGCIATIRYSDHIWLDKLYVSPDHQRQGLGAAVLRRLVTDAAAQGLPLRLCVLTTNPAINFYKREGLKVFGETPQRIFMEHDALLGLAGPAVPRPLGRPLMPFA